MTSICFLSYWTLPHSPFLRYHNDTTVLIVLCGQMWLKQTIHNQHGANVLKNEMIGTILSSMFFHQNLKIFLP